MKYLLQEYPFYSEEFSMVDCRYHCVVESFSNSVMIFVSGQHMSIPTCKCHKIIITNNYYLITFIIKVGPCILQWQI